MLSYEEVCELIGIIYGIVCETTRILENCRDIHVLFSIGYAYHIKVRELLRLVSELLAVRMPILEIGELSENLTRILRGWVPTLARACEEALGEVYSMIAKAEKEHGLTREEAHKLVGYLSRVAELKGVLLHLLAMELEWHLRQRREQSKMFMAEILREAAKGFEDYRELVLELSAYL